MESIRACDLQMALAVLGAAFGTIVHILKKAIEDGEQEKGIFRRWVLDKPVNTIATVLVGIGLAIGLQSQLAGVSNLMVALISLNAGYCANSLVNRPGGTQ